MLLIDMWLQLQYPIRFKTTKIRHQSYNSHSKFCSADSQLDSVAIDSVISV